MRVVHISSRETVLQGVALGEGYDGPETYRSGGEFATADGSLTGGIWSYDGGLVSTNPGTAHQLWVVVSGSLEVDIASEAICAAPGDVVLFEAPYPPKTVRASGNFRAVWLAVNRGASA